MTEKTFTHIDSGPIDPVPSGVWPVVLTPYDATGAVDLGALDRYCDALIDWGAAGLFPVALSGEMYELSETERRAVAQRVVNCTAGRVPVVAALSDGGTADQIAAAVTRMTATGVDAVILIASRLVDEDADEAALRSVVEVVLRANPDVDFGIYECPIPHHRLLSTETVQWLAHTGRFSFFKETSHDVARMAERVRAAEGTPLRIFTAGIENLVDSLEVGVVGLSGWIANVYPDEVARVIELNRAGETGAADRVQAALVRVEQGFGPTYPSSAKYLVSTRVDFDFRSDSRWRPATLDGEILAHLDALAASLTSSLEADR